MASRKPVPCGPCKQGKVNTKADIWCHNCGEGLCSTCSSHHKRIKSSRDHRTIDIQTYTSYKPPTGLIKTECDAHSLQFNLYCPSHLMPCCDECISTSHSKCTGIKSLASVVEKTKIEKSKESVEKEISSITYFLDKLVNNKSDNIRRGEKQYETIKQSVSKIRNEINEHLDNLEEKLCKEAETIWGQQKSKLTILITEIEGKQKILKEMKNDLKTVTEHTSKLQSFLGEHQIEHQVYRFQRYIEDSEGSSEVDIKLMPNDEVEKVLTKVQSLTSLGEVEVVKTEVSLKRKTSVIREAQIELQEQSSINNMTMNIGTTIQNNMHNQLSAIICLPDERFIVVEHTTGKVNLLNSDGKLEKELPLPGKAWSATQINKNTIAVTCPVQHAIKIFNMEDETVTKVITLHKKCYGLSFSNNSLAVGLNKVEIRIIDLEGKTLKSIQVECKSFLYSIVYFNDRVIYSDFRGKAVCCADGSGHQIWQYKQNLSRPVGLCTDRYGNIIVVDSSSKRIIVLPKDGQDSKELTKRGEIGYMPWFICVSKSNESDGFICDAYGKSITRFNLSYD